jgi:thiamine biosynthesis protein ThiS
VRIVLNGEAREVPEGTSVAGLLRSLDLAESRVAVERNREVLPRERHEEAVLREGDRVEVVRFVGGG